MKKAVPKKYELKLMSDMLDIPEDRFEEFLIDLRKWHKVSIGFDKLFRETAKETNKAIPKDYIAMRWVDDCIHDGPVKVIVEGKK